MKAIQGFVPEPAGGREAAAKSLLQAFPAAWAAAAPRPPPLALLLLSPGMATRRVRSSCIARRYWKTSSRSSGSPAHASTSNGSWMEISSAALCHLPSSKTAWRIPCASVARKGATSFH